MNTQNKEKEKSFFDDFVIANDYDVFNDYGYNRILKELLSNLNFSNRHKLKLLDMGCGTGVFTSKLQHMNFEMYGVDISSESIKIAKEKYNEIEFSVGDIESTSFDDATFDIVLLSGVLHHFNDFNKVIQECYRVLNKGGVLFAYDPHCNNPIMWLYRCKKSPFYSSKGVTENEQPLYKKQIDDVLSKHPFKTYSVYGISGVTYKYVESKIAYIFMPVYNLVERFFDIPFIRKKYGSFLISVAVK